MSHTHCRAHWADIERAAYRVIHEYRNNGQHGAQALGPRIGKSPALLCNEANPDYAGAKLGLLTAVNC